MQKKSSLVIILIMAVFITGFYIVSAACDESQRIMRISSASNAYGQLWNQGSPSGTLPFYRLYKTGTGYFYTANYDEAVNARENLGYSYEGVAAYVYTTEEEGTMPFYRLYKTGTGYFYTANYSESVNARENLGYSYEGVAAYVYTEEPGYPVEICYDEIFGEAYTGSNPHECAATIPNKIASLSSNTNALAEIPNAGNYPVDVCYGNLICAVRTSCNADEELIVSLSSETDANLSNGSDYDVKICCKSGIAAETYWANMNNNPINKTDLNDKVKLIVSGAFSINEIEYNIYKDGFWFFDRQISQTSSLAFTTWMANQTGTYYFVAKATALDGSITEIDSRDTPNYGYLEVGETEDNANPEAVMIILPAFAHLPIVNPDERNYLVGSIINFEQASYDEDDALKITWGFGDAKDISCLGTNCPKTEYNNFYAGSGVNCNTTHIYTSSGTKVVSLNAKEMERNQEDTDYKEIYLYDEGINVFPVISEPENGFVAEGTREVHFRANDSYAANCSYKNCPGAAYNMQCYNIVGIVNGVDKTLQCFNYPKEGTHGIGKTAGKYNLWFNWTFSESPARYGNWVDNYNDVVNFAREFQDTGKQHAFLKIGFEGF